MTMLKFPTRPPVPPSDPEWVWDEETQIGLLEAALQGKQTDTVEGFVANEIMNRLYMPGPDNETVAHLRYTQAVNFFVLCKMLRKYSGQRTSGD